MDKDWAEAFLEEVAEIPFIDYKDHKKRWMDLFNSYMRKVRREAIESCAVIADETLVPTTAKLIRESEGKV